MRLRSRYAPNRTPGFKGPSPNIHSLSAWECLPGRSAAAFGQGEGKRRHSGQEDDAERRRRHSHAERGNELRDTVRGPVEAIGSGVFGAGTSILYFVLADPRAAR